jgi:hypothetical protein
MPPKIDPARARAIANGPVEGWRSTPIARNFAANGTLAADYLCAFLKGGNMPVTREQVDNMNGPRLWRMLELHVPAEYRDGTNVRPEAVTYLVKLTNHGFSASAEAQQRFTAFVDLMSSSVATVLRDHYMKCNAFRAPVAQLGTPPSHLDFFKDERVHKSWRMWEGMPMILLHANDMLIAWPDLMPASWDATHASRDAAAAWTRASSDVDELHRGIDSEGALIY